MNPHFDSILVGAGIMGGAAGFELVRAGQSVLMIDAYDPPHEHGSHHGDTRIFRHAYSADPVYVRLALLADAGWRELESLSGVPLLQRIGVLNMYPIDSTSYRGKLAYAERFGLNVAAMDTDEIRRTWPGIRLPDHYGGLFEPDGGVLASEACVHAYRRLAEQCGATVVTNAPVSRIELASDRVSVHAAGRVYYADRLLLTAGASCSQLLPGLTLPVTKIRKSVAWFEADDLLYASNCFPAFNYEGPEGELYGFPSFSGAGVKVGRHDGGEAIAPSQPLQPFGTHHADEAELRSFLSRHMPRAAGPLLRGAVCSYERTPDEHFILDRHPEYEHVYIAAGFSGHGFKFASAIGRTLCEWIMTGTLDDDLSFFSLTRFR